MTTQDTKTETPKKKKYTWEVVTRAVKGYFLIGDREFIDQPFTRAERSRLMNGLREGATVLEMVIAGLNERHAGQHQTAVTQDWLDEQLSDQDLDAVVTRIKSMVGVE